MIGIVVVSHSLALAEAAVALADEMVHGEGPVVAVAAGAGGGFGTDASEVRRAMEKAASPDGVLVLMDLGSAVLSAELALELGAPADHDVRLSAAPVVEGLVAAVVRAAGGADLDTVAREAEAALLPKVISLAEHSPRPGSVSSVEADASVRLTLVNPQGLHARPAAQIATAVGGPGGGRRGRGRRPAGRRVQLAGADDAGCRAGYGDHACRRWGRTRVVRSTSCAASWRRGSGSSRPAELWRRSWTFVRGCNDAKRPGYPEVDRPSHPQPATASRIAYGVPVSTTRVSGGRRARTAPRTLPRCARGRPATTSMFEVHEGGLPFVAGAIQQQLDDQHDAIGRAATRGTGGGS